VNFDLTINVKRTSTTQLSREQCNEVALWIEEHLEDAPESVRFFLGLHQRYLGAEVNQRLRFDETLRELRRALGITSSSERRRSSDPLGPLGRAKVSSIADERQRLEAQRDRADRLGDWHEKLTAKHQDKSRRLNEKLSKMKEQPKIDPMVEAQQEGPSALELSLIEEISQEPYEQTEEQKAEAAAKTKAFVEHLELGQGAIDEELEPVNETLMPEGEVVTTEQFEQLSADVTEQTKGSEVVKHLEDKRVRYDISVTVSRLELDVDKQVLVNANGERTVVSASTNDYGPARYSVTWTALATLAVLVGQYAFPLNRMAKLFSAAGKRFTASGLSRLLHYIAERFYPVYIELSEQLSDADILSGDDTSSRVLEVEGYFKKLKSSRKKGKKRKAPWSEYRTPVQAQQNIDRLEEQQRVREQQRANGQRVSNQSPKDRVSLGMLIGRHHEFESQRQDGKGAKQSLNTTVVTGRSVSKDPRSLIVYYRTHLGAFGNLLESILHNRNPSAKQVIVQSDLSTTNLINDSELLSRHDFKYIGCSAHARRPFALYEDQDPIYCPYILHLFTGLAMHEDCLDDFGRNRYNVSAVRQHESRRMWEHIREVATTIASRWSKATKLGAGARYILRHYDKLTAYLDDPRLEPTNNLRERMLRTEKLIESSSMFRRSLEGRFVFDIIRTILQTAVAARVPVHEYLLSVLKEDPKEIASHPERYTPRAWAQRETAE